MKDNIRNAIRLIQEKGHILGHQQGVIGFDGFIDSIVRVIKEREDKDNFTAFNDMGEFGNYIISKKGKSCSLELNEETVKIGGNMPIYSMALGTLGLNINCIGAMGYPDIDPHFRPMARYNCVLHSISEPGYTTALEFHDGKIMLTKMGPIMDITWDSIKSKVGLDKLINFFGESHILGLVNWSEVENSSSIWKGILEDVLIHHTPNKEQIAFFDLSDCSKRHREDIEGAFDIMGEYSKHFKVILGMNENECRIVYEALYPDSVYKDFIHAGDRLFEEVGVDVLVVHPRDSAVAWDKSGRFRAENLYIKVPKLSTGGGDNFNAGFSMGQLMGMDILSSLIVGNAVSGFYVKHGNSPNRKQLVDFLLEWKDQITK